MNICLIGYGKMGKVIERLAKEQGHQINAIIDENAQQVDWQNAFDTCDVAIEFTEPNAAINNINNCFKGNLPVVVGTTGWYEHFDEVSKNCHSLNGSLFYATNFSVGVNILFHLNKVLANIMQNQKEYQPTLKEVHHIHKKDSPSGTGITLAEGLISNYQGIDAWKEIEAKGAFQENELPIYAEREGEVPGYHEVIYESNIDTISISHEAKGREGFAQGAIKAAEWLMDKKGIFTMNDMLNFK